MVTGVARGLQTRWQALIKSAVSSILTRSRYFKLFLYPRMTYDRQYTYGKPAASGIYLCVLKSGSFTALQKMVLIR